MYLKLITVFLFLCLSAIRADITIEAGANQVELIGPVNEKSVMKFVTAYQRYLQNEDVVTIDVLINSPGGSVYHGTTVVDLMTMARARGVTTRCYVGGMAASMAFIILAHCDERYVLPHSKLLFHPISMFLMGNFELYSIEKYIQQTLVYERNTIKELIEITGMEEESFIENYKMGTLWHAKELAAVTDDFLTVVVDIKGFKNVFKMPPIKDKNNYRALTIPRIYQEVK